MSELSDFRSDYARSIAEAHGQTTPVSLPSEPTLPAGHVWKPYRQSTRPPAPRTRGIKNPTLAALLS